jgi:hypothetical protein
MFQFYASFLLMLVVLSYKISRNGTDNEVAKRTYLATMMNIHHLQNPFTVS